MISLDEFCNQERDAIDAFQKYWKENQEKDNKSFPTKMDDSEWIEQFLGFDIKETNDIIR